jgi:hypothetical protein
MASEQPWTRQGEAFWRAHHEAWKRSDLNQRQYCEAHGLPQKAFENWRQKFRAEPQLLERRLLYRRRPLSPPLSPPVSPLLSPVTYTSSQLAGPIVARPREGHRRRLTPVLKADDDIISIAHDDHVARGLPSSPAFGPQIEDVVQVLWRTRRSGDTFDEFYNDRSSRRRCRNSPNGRLSNIGTRAERITPA